MKDYYIGLDIGTDSVGWAVTNQDYSIPKFKGNSMWGIRLLDESKTAEERRGFRSARRRTDRNKFRMQCLESLFNEEISKKDIAFFQRIKESNLYLEDKTVGGKFSIFNDDNFTDKEYYSNYPTIYHLRKELIENEEKHDIRLIYLAIAHLIKNRGHFLFDTLGEGKTLTFTEVWWSLCNYINDNFIDDEDNKINIDDFEKIQSILKNKTGITKKKEALVEILDCKSDEFKKAICVLLSGGKIELAKLFDDEELKEIEEKSITFSTGFDEKASTIENEVGPERFELIEKIKAVYDWSILADILKDNEYISYAKCQVYDKHKEDLKKLKKFVKTELANKEIYNKIFNENQKGLNNYLSYSGYTKNNSVEKKCSQMEFCEFLNKTLPKVCPKEEYLKMYDEIKDNVFMPKIVSKDNSVIPMQINLVELKKILENAKKNYKFLEEIDEKGKTVEEKIIDIFKFRVPYYVGPLNNHSDKAWVVKKNNEKIYPWNFNEVIDIDKSAEAFIENLTSKCTYLHKEDVIAKNSILYSKFMVLNELNNLKINGEKVSNEDKKEIFNLIFLKRNKVTQKAIINYFISKYGENQYEISGIDGDFKSNMKSYIDLKNYDISEQDKDEIIRLITIFGDDKKILKKRLKKQYSTKLKEEEIDKIAKLKYSAWGNLSKKFLNGMEAVNKETGEIDTVLGFLWNTNNNLMQLLSNKYGFIEEIQKENSDEKFKGLKEEIDELYVSPKIKRPIYQTMQIIDEIVKIQKSEPQKIFIEVAKGEEEKKRTISRKSKLIELYKTCGRDGEVLYNQIKNTDETEFRRDALYLYYTQFGKCMYTGKNIDIEEIYNKNIYDIDHIFPQSKIKDDSIDNRVLVLKTANEEKTNIYPIPENLKQLSLWKILLDKNLISKKKYERLTRVSPLTDDELNSFISRQLVETRQSTKAINEIINKKYPNIKVIPVKAKLASEFRQNYDILKCREVNDLHHAKDAYLNIVVGNVYYTKFTSKYFINELQTGKASLNCMYKYNVDGAWIADNNKSISLVKQTVNKNNIKYTRYSFKQKGGLFDQNILKKGNGQVPIKANSALSDINKYGGYNRATATYFAYVQYKDNKGNVIRSFEPIDLYLEDEYNKNPIEFIKKKLNVAEAEIIIKCVKYNTLIEVNGFRMHISSKSGGGSTLVCKPAVQLVIGYEYEKEIKNIINYLNKCKEIKKEKEVTEFDKISKETNIKIYNRLLDKLQHSVYNKKFNGLADKLETKIEEFSNLKIYEQCIIISEILNILHCNVVSGDLSLICEAKKSGITTIGNKINNNLNSFKIINQSVTGLYEKNINLLK